jgi:hypothetical protein
VTDENLSKDSVRVKDVTNRVRSFFFRFPHSSAKECCRHLDIPYKKYRNLCWRIKSETKQLLEGKVEARVHVPLKHREELRVDLPREVVDSVVFEAGRRRPGKADVKPFGEWYVAPNRNRMMLLRNDYLTIRVFPRSGTCRILLAKSMPYEWIKTSVQDALFKAGVDLRVCEKLSETVEPKSRSRIFKVGQVTPFKIDFYKEPLGVTIKADESHQDFIEVDEDWPTWIKPLLAAMAKHTEALEALRMKFPQDLERITISFEKSMQEHLDIIKVFREESLKRSDSAEKLGDALNRLASNMEQNFEIINRLLVTIGSKLVRRRSRVKPRPKKKSRWQRLMERIRR